MPTRYAPIEVAGTWHVVDRKTGSLILCESRTVAIDHAARLNFLEALRAA